MTVSSSSWLIVKRLGFRSRPKVRTVCWNSHRVSLTEQSVVEHSTIPCIRALGSVHRQSLSVEEHDICSSSCREQLCCEDLSADPDEFLSPSQRTVHDGSWSSRSCAWAARTKNNEKHKGSRIPMMTLVVNQEVLYHNFQGTIIDRYCFASRSVSKSRARYSELCERNH